MEVKSPRRQSLCGISDKQNMQGGAEVTAHSYSDDNASNCSFQTPRSSTSSETKDSEIQTDFSWIRNSQLDKNLKTTPISLWSSCDNRITCSPQCSDGDISFSPLKSEKSIQKRKSISLGIQQAEIWCTDSYLSGGEESETTSESSCDSDSDTVYAVETEVLSPPNSPSKGTFNSTDGERIIPPVTYQVVVHEEVTNVIYHLDKTECIVYGLRRQPLEHTEYIPDTIAVNITETQTQNTCTTNFCQSDEHVHFSNDDIDSDTNSADIIHQKSQTEIRDATVEGNKTKEEHLIEEQDIQFIDLPVTSTPRPVHIDIPSKGPEFDPFQLCSPKDSDTTSDYGTIAPENDNRTELISACLNSSDDPEQTDSPLDNYSNKSLDDTDAEKLSQYSLNNPKENKFQEKSTTSDENVTGCITSENVVIEYIDTYESDTSNISSDSTHGFSDTGPEYKEEKQINISPHEKVKLYSDVSQNDKDIRNEQMNACNKPLEYENADEDDILPVHIQKKACDYSFFSECQKLKLENVPIGVDTLSPKYFVDTQSSSRCRSFSDSAIDTSYTECDSPGPLNEVYDEKENDSLSDGEIPQDVDINRSEKTLSDGEIKEEPIVSNKENKPQLPCSAKLTNKYSKTHVLKKSLSDSNIDGIMRQDILNSSDDSIIFVFVNQEPGEIDDSKSSPCLEDNMSLNGTSSKEEVHSPTKEDICETNDIPLHHRYGIDEDVLPMTDKSVSLGNIPKIKQTFSSRLCHSCDCLSSLKFGCSNDAENNEGIFPPYVDNIDGASEVVSDEILDEVDNSDNLQNMLKSIHPCQSHFTLESGDIYPFYLVPKMEYKRGQNPRSTEVIQCDTTTSSTAVPRQNRKWAHSDSEIDLYEKTILLKLPKEINEWEDLSTMLLNNSKFIDDLRMRLPGTNFLYNFEKFKDYSTQTSGSLNNLHDLSIQTDEVQSPKLPGSTQTDTAYTRPRKCTDIETLEILPEPTKLCEDMQLKKPLFSQALSQTRDSSIQTESNKDFDSDITDSSPSIVNGVKCEEPLNENHVVYDKNIDHKTRRSESFTKNTDKFNHTIFVERELVVETEANVPNMEFTHVELNKLKEEHDKMMQSLDKAAKERDLMTKTLKSKLKENKNSLKVEIQNDMFKKSTENLNKLPSNNSSYEKVSDLDMSIPLEDPFKMAKSVHVKIKKELQNLNKKVIEYPENEVITSQEAQKSFFIHNQKKDQDVTDMCSNINNKAVRQSPEPTSLSEDITEKALIVPTTNEDKMIDQNTLLHKMVDEVIQTDDKLQNDELTQTDENILKLDLSQFNSHEATKSISSEDSVQNAGRETKEKYEFLEQLPMNYFPPSLTVERLEAKLNYSIGETDSCIKTIQDNWSDIDTVIKKEHNTIKENISEDNIKKSDKETYQHKIYDRSVPLPHRRRRGIDKTKTLLQLHREAEIEAFEIERLLEKQKQMRNKIVNTIDFSSENTSDSWVQNSSPNGSLLLSPRLMTPKDHRDHMVRLRRKLVQATEHCSTPRESRSCSPRSYCNDNLDSPRFSMYNSRGCSPVISPRINEGKTQFSHHHCHYQSNLRTPTSPRSRSFSPECHSLDVGKYEKNPSPITPQKQPTRANFKISTSNTLLKKVPSGFDSAHDRSHLPPTLDDIDWKDLLMEVRNTRIANQQEISRMQHFLNSVESDCWYESHYSLPSRRIHLEHDNDVRSVTSSDGTLIGSYELYEDSSC